MPDTDFAAASTRHFRDARILLDSGSYDNCLYLSGYVVECALKAVSDRPGLAPERLGHKLLRLEGEALELAMVLSPATARYRPRAASTRAVNDAWSPSCRYRPNSVARQQAEAIFEQAKSVWEDCIGEMFLDGLIQELP